MAPFLLGLGWIFPVTATPCWPWFLSRSSDSHHSDMSLGILKMMEIISLCFCWDRWVFSRAFEGSLPGSSDYQWRICLVHYPSPGFWGTRSIWEICPQATFLFLGTSLCHSLIYSWESNSFGYIWMKSKTLMLLNSHLSVLPIGKNTIGQWPFKNNNNGNNNNTLLFWERYLH